MTRPDPGAGTSDSAKGFAGAEDAWNAFKSWIYNGPQVKWIEIRAHIDKVKAARQ